MYVAIFYYAQVIRSLGPLELVLNTPSHHRVHHGKRVLWFCIYCFVKNCNVIFVPLKQIQTLHNYVLYKSLLFSLSSSEKPELQS